MSLSDWNLVFLPNIALLRLHGSSRRWAFVPRKCSKVYLCIWFQNHSIKLGKTQNVTFSALRGRGHAPMVPIMENIVPPMPPSARSPPWTSLRRPISARRSGSRKRSGPRSTPWYRATAAKVGLARESLSRALSTPHVAEHLRQKVLRHLAIHAARAGATKTELLDSASEIVRDRASSFVLGLAGIQPATTPSVSVNLGIKAGYVIDLSDDPPPAMRTIPHI